jgi:uncharacterized protein
VQSTLVDAGPLIALFDKREKSHTRALARFREARGPLATTWAVLAEVAALSYWVNWVDCLEFVAAGAVSVHHIEQTDVTALVAHAKKYRDLPMDLADASLVVLAAKLGTKRIMTLDSDFRVYRLAGNKAFDIIW